MPPKRGVAGVGTKSSNCMPISTRVRASTGEDLDSDDRTASPSSVPERFAEASLLDTERMAAELDVTPSLIPEPPTLAPVLTASPPPPGARNPAQHPPPTEASTNAEPSPPHGGGDSARPPNQRKVSGTVSQIFPAQKANEWITANASLKRPVSDVTDGEELGPLTLKNCMSKSTVRALKKMRSKSCRSSM